MRPSLPNDEVLYFRNAMAERGVEYTPEQAKTAKECLDNFLEEMRNLDLDQIRQLKSLTISDKIDILQAYMEETGQEMDVQELDDIIQLCIDAHQDGDYE